MKCSQHGFFLTGNTPLMYACAGGHEDIVQVLLDAGAQVRLIMKCLVY